MNFPNEQHPLQAHIVQEIELSESEVAIPRAIPYGKFKILHQAPSNDASTATSSNETSSKATRESPFTSQLRGLHLCPAASASASAPASISAFCPCFHLCLLSLFPPLPLACASVSTPASIIVFAFRLCFRAPVFAFALRPPLCFHLRVRARSSPSSAAAASPRVAGFTPPPGNADLNSRPKAIIPSPSERLSLRSPGRARGPSSTPEQPLDCPLFRQFR